MKQNNTIEICNMSKDFKFEYDKPSTLKERLVFWKKRDKQYHHVLKNINLNIKKGDSVALIGTNGSGKSTLLKLMTKILYPTKGTIVTHGKLTSLLELGAGFHQDFTGRENIYFNASIFGLTKEEIDKRVDDIIRFSELEEFIDAPVRTYSSGMYMRLAFSVAINVDADILLIDEILAVGDQHFQDKCFDKLYELKESDTTIVIVSHSLETIKDLCNRAIWIYDGQVKMDGESEEVIDAYLDQIEIDNQKKKLKLANKSGKIHGLINIDLPKNRAKYKRGRDLQLAGWQICENEDTVLKIKLDNDEIEISNYFQRDDVLTTYSEQITNFIPRNKVGFDKKISLSKYEYGQHTLLAQIICNEQVVSERKIKFLIEE